ncbi:hypothetical protein PUNSTDRAFT_84829 [Punctularia strigosozonata HHB-11173 SS5]|uniref:uncharacterized protein n=1 Tax=Punctularia strigosozonata (strain HHB-11173) TaxID=741275 RepID=UPI000441801C|nr:uncharacterized protein PUNSTDRAFT_84829 [Punctularia strigosozonata HHB-11173 SS5]EIN10630.1 hypothetical protein PUNSTDRAFT_84829 [Punctularia strigosozonata HHB-11173 SS5]
MSETFARFRLTAYIIFFLLSAAVLGLAANFANEFLPHIHSDFIIFSLVVSAASILALILLLSWSQPRTEVLFVIIVGILWLSEAAWAEDIIGHVQCSDIASSDTVPTKNGSTSSRAYCREMKVLEAFSWMLFALFFISFWIIVVLTSRAKTLGQYYAWQEPIAELPWFGEYPGYEGMAGGGPRGYPMYYPYPQAQPAQGGFVVSQGGHVVQQQPGHSLIVQPGQNGQAPTITQVPGQVQSVM